MCYIVFSPDQWRSFADIKEFAGFSDVIQSTASSLSDMQIFGVLNIADQPLGSSSASTTAGMADSVAEFPFNAYCESE